MHRYNVVICQSSCSFFLNDTATTEIYTHGHTLSLHDALPICEHRQRHKRSLQPLGAVDLHRSAADDPGVIRLRLQNRACQQFAIYGSHEFQVAAAPLARPEARLKPADKPPWPAPSPLDGLHLGTTRGAEALQTSRERRGRKG